MTKYADSAGASGTTGYGALIGMAVLIGSVSLVFLMAKIADVFVVVGRAL